MAEPTKLRDETRELLKNRPATLEIKTIAADLGVSVGWLNQFARGKIENPGVVTICALNNYLSNFNKKKAAK
jgi:transcriptional regulator with XRE-family HTH domain